MFWAFSGHVCMPLQCLLTAMSSRFFLILLSSWRFVSVASNYLLGRCCVLSATPGHQQLQLSLFSFILPCFQPSPVNNFGILFWFKHSKFRLCTYTQGLCCHWLILLGFSFQRLCDKSQCSPERCTFLSCWRRFRLVFLSAAGSHSRAWWRTDPNWDSKSEGEAFSWAASSTPNVSFGK